MRMKSSIEGHRVLGEMEDGRGTRKRGLWEEVERECRLHGACGVGERPEHSGLGGFYSTARGLCMSLGGVPERSVQRLRG